MIFSKQLLKHSLKSVKITSLIGLSALLFTQGLVQTELRASTNVPNSYDVSELFAPMNREIPNGYIKANYKINVISPSTNASDLSANEAAEIVAQELFKLFKMKLSNETIKMAYEDAADSMYCTSYWSGEIDHTPNYRATVKIDSRTGELLSIRKTTMTPSSSSGKLSDNEKDTKTCQSMASASNKIKQNLAASCAKAQALIASSGYLSDTIKSTNYQTTTSSVLYYNGKPLSPNTIHHFIVTTSSGQTYYFKLSTDLTQIEGVSTSKAEEGFKAYNSLHPDNN